MAIPVVKKVKVLEAGFVPEASSVLIICECAEGKFKNLIPSSCFTFGDKDIEVEMQKLAELMVGKTIQVAFDTELDGKIKDHYKLKY